MQCYIQPVQRTIKHFNGTIRFVPDKIVIAGRLNNNVDFPAHGIKYTARARHHD